MASDAEQLARILVALQGVTVLEKPRVPRETIISVLQEHTGMIKEIKTEISSMSIIMKALVNEAADTKKKVESLSDDVKNVEKNCDDINKNMKRMKQDLDNISEELEALKSLKQIVKEQADNIEVLDKRLGHHEEEVAAHIRKTITSIAKLEEATNDTQGQLLELKDVVDHFGENLMVSATQVTVEASAGLSQRPINLLEALTRVNTSVTNADANIQNHALKIASNAADILTKADIAVLFDVDKLGERLKIIEVHIKREEEQGVGAIRKQCESLVEEVQLIQSLVADKVDQVSVDAIVHRKYEDIVTYLQDALQSTAEDENNFQVVAEDLKKAMTHLETAKADRVDIAPMQEVLVKTEAMLSKVLSEKKSQSGGAYTKKEIDDLLNNKVNKEEWEAQVLELAKSVKRRGNTVGKGGLAPMTDESTTISTGAITGGGGGALQPQLNSLSPSNRFQQPSPSQQQQQQYQQQQQQYQQQQQQQHYIQQWQQGTALGGALSGGGTGTAGGGAGLLLSQSTGALPSVSARHGMIAQGDSPYTAGIEFSVVDEALGSPLITQQGRLVNSAGTPVDGGSSSPAGSVPPSTEFAQHMKLKKEKHVQVQDGLMAQPQAGSSASASSLSPILGANSKHASARPLQSNNPGFFRPAGDSGYVSGGDARSLSPTAALRAERPQGVVSSNSHDSYQNAPEYPHVPPDVVGRIGHDMSFLGGPYMGGGFNLKAGQIRAGGAMLRPMGLGYETADLEGSGSMLKGSDGRYYYTDNDEDAEFRSSNGPNVVPVKPALANQVKPSPVKKRFTDEIE